MKTQWFHHPSDPRGPYSAHEAGCTIYRYEIWHRAKGRFGGRQWLYTVYDPIGGEIVVGTDRLDTAKARARQWSKAHVSTPARIVMDMEAEGDLLPNRGSHGY